MNLDETSICVHQPSPRGIICVDRKRARTLTQHVPRSKRRRYMTYVSVICDDEAAQATLPQFLIGNEATLRKCDMLELRATLSPNVRLVRQKSAWNDQRMMVQILRELRLSLLPFLSDVQPIILWDAARQHTTPLVFASAIRLGIWPITVPAKLTWLLQPLDTHAFVSFKRRLEQSHQAARIGGPSGDVEFPTFIQCVCATINETISHQSWSGAFDSDGFSHLQTRVSARVRSNLEVDESFGAISECPTLDQVALCFPKRFRLTREIAFGPMLKSALPKPALLRSKHLGTDAFARVPVIQPLPFGRTRSETRALRLRARCVSYDKFAGHRKFVRCCRDS